MFVTSRTLKKTEIGGFGASKSFVFTIKPAELKSVRMETHITIYKELIL